MKFFLTAFLIPLHLLFSLSKEDIKKIGNKIFQNECSQKKDFLTFWNVSESFPSFGIGHFIWYPEGKEFAFEETFPSLISFLKEKQALIPSWLNTHKHCPWPTREAFYKDFSSKTMEELRKFFFDTQDLQAEFIIQRFEKNCTKILKDLSDKERQKAKKMFDALSKKPEGFFAMVDYGNSKGFGTSLKERYKDEGWGLLQVLLDMQETGDEKVLESFVASAKKVLRKRIANAPLEKKEEQFFLGWTKRLDRYLESFY